MSLFSIPSGTGFGSFFKEQKSEKVSTESTVNPDVISQRATALKKSEHARSVYAEENKTVITGAILPGMKNPPQIRREECKFASKEDIDKYTFEAKAIFVESLTSSLFVNKLNHIAIEACPIDREVVGRTDIQQFMFEMAHNMFKDLSKIKNFRKVAEENKMPSFVCELYELAYESACTEAAGRFHPNIVAANCGLSIEKVNEYVSQELDNVFISNESTADYFNQTSAVIVVENEDVIETIRAKVTSELDNYKESAKKVDDLKKAVSADTEPSKPAEPVAPPAEEPPVETPPTEDPNAPAGEAAPEEPPVEEPVEPKPETESEPTPAAIAESVAAEIDDAANFAESKTHTFNSGNEKFDMLRAKYAAEVVDAINKNDLQKLNELKANITSAADRLESISKSSNDKYSDSVKKIRELAGSVAFELNKKIERTAKDARESYTIFENFVLSIGSRYYDKISMEGGSFADIPGDKVIQESLIYYTTLETFNTLKILDLGNAPERKHFAAFMESSFKK